MTPERRIIVVTVTADSGLKDRNRDVYTRSSFRACRVFEEAGQPRPRVVDLDLESLSAGNVVVRVQWSGINYKDALALTGRGKILRRFPLNA